MGAPKKPLTEDRMREISHTLMKAFFQTGGAIADIDFDDTLRMLNLDEDEILEYIDRLYDMEPRDDPPKNLPSR